MSKMLLDDQPLLVLPKLATKIGLNESIVVQQIHYWLLKKLNSKDGYYWVYNTSKDWVKQFPFWSESTVKRTIKNLEEKDLIITGNYNKLQIDRTKWYRINYEELMKYDDTEVFDGRDRLGQIDTMDDSNWHDGQVNMTRPLPETTTKTTKDIKDIVPLKQDSIDYEGLVNYLNFKTGKNFRHKTVKTRDLIRARINEGFVMEDFKTVIDNKTEQWLNDPERNEYLRPETLFGNKFEGYLNQSKISNIKQTKKLDPWEAELYEHYGREQNTNDNRIGLPAGNKGLF